MYDARDRNDKSSPIWCTKIILRHHYCTAVRILQILEFEYNQVLSYTLQALARATDPPTRKRTSHAIFSWITLQLSRWGILVGFSSLWSKEYKTTPPPKKKKKKKKKKEEAKTHSSKNISPAFVLLFFWSLEEFAIVSVISSSQPTRRCNFLIRSLGKIFVYRIYDINPTRRWVIILNTFQDDSVHYTLWMSIRNSQW